MNPCSPEVLAKILDKRRSQLQSRGLTNAQIKIDLDHVKAMLLNPVEYETKVASKLNIALTEAETQELTELKNRLQQGFALGKTKTSDILGEADARRFKVLLYKDKVKRTPTTEVGPDRGSIDSLAERERVLQEAGNTRAARRIRTIRRKLERLDKQNKRLGKDYKTVNNLDERLRQIEEDIIAYQNMIEEGATGLEAESAKFKKRLTTISERKAKLGQALEKVNEKIDATADSKEKGRLKKEASKLKKQIDKINKEYQKALMTFREAAAKVAAKKRDTPIGKAISDLKKERFTVIQELSKFGISKGISLNNIIDNAPTTARQLAIALEEVSKDIEFKTTVIDNLFKDSDTVDAVVVSQLFGENFVMQRVEKNKTLTRKEVNNLFAEYKAISFEYAGSRERFIMDMEFSDKESLEEIQNTSIDPESEKGLIDEASGDYPVVPTLPLKEAGLLSNPGIIPPSNMFAETEGEVLYGKLRSLLYRMETLRRLPQFGKMVDIAFISKIMSDIEKLDDVNAAILFKSAISWDEGDTRVGFMSHDEITSVARSVLTDLGLDESVFSNQEFTDPINWVENADVFSFDIETYLDGSDGIHTIILMDESQTNDYSSVRSSNDNNTFTAEELMQVLRDIEQKQNQGRMLVTFNGNSFDLLALAEKIGTEESRKMAARIVLRSVDIFQNLRSWESTTNTDNNPKSRMYSLANTTTALNIEQTKLAGSHMPSLWKKRSTGQTVTVEDLSKIPNEKISEGEKQEIVDQVNELDPKEASRFLADYSLIDGALNIDVLKQFRQRRGAPVRIAYADGNIYSVSVQTMAPTWGLAASKSPQFGGIADATSAWSYLPEGRVMATAFDGLLPREHDGKTVIDLDKAQGIIMSLMALSLEFSPNTKAFGKAMFELAERGVTPTEQAYLIAVNIARENTEAAKAMNKESFVRNGRRLQLGIRGVKETGGYVPGITFAEGSESMQKEQYIQAVAQGALSQMQSMRLNLSDLAEAVEFEPKDTTTDERTYIVDLIIHTIKRYSDYKDFDIVDFGNGNIDYAIADSLGRGVVQIIGNSQQGFRKSMNSDATMIKSDEIRRAEEIAKASEGTEKTNASLIYRLPLLSEVHHIFPRTLDQIESAFTDYKLRQRLNHILSAEIKSGAEAREIIERYMGQTENPEEVLATTSTELLNILPNINNRKTFNRLPTMAEYRRRTIEALLDLPELLMMWQHDSVTYAPGAKIFLDEATKGRMFAEDALSPGSLSGKALLSGLGPLFAHVKTYPMLTEELVYKSLEKGIAANGEYSLSNYFDFNMNGVHHMAALSLMYLDGGESTLDKILEEFELVDQAKDRYKEAVNILKDNLPRIKEAYSKIPNRDTSRRGMDQADKLLKFLEESPIEARESFKTAVIARLYMGGYQAVYDGIRNWMFETGSNMNGVDAAFIAEHLMNVKGYAQMHILDTAIGNLTEDDRRTLARRIASTLQGFYSSTGWHENLRKIAIKNGFTDSGRRMFSLDQVEEAIKERIRFIAELEQRPVEEVEKDYATRIENATKYIESIGGQISGPEQMRELNIILMGSEEAYRTTPALAALNALQRVPYRLRGTKSEGIQGRIDQHRDILGVYIEEADFLGYENFNIYFTQGFDSSGGRLYMWGHRHQPQNSKLSSVERENTPDNKDDNEYAMWAFGRNNLGSKGREVAIEEIDKLIARDIAIKLSRSYAPKFGNYDTATTETRQGFLKEWERRSELENRQWQRSRGSEASLSPEDRTRQLRKSNGSLLQNTARFFLDPTRDYSDALSAAYNPSSDSNLKGLGAFRPEYAGMPWVERGIFSLQEMYYNRALETLRSTRVSRPSRDITSINDVIPTEARGYKNRYKGSSVPYIYQTPFDSTYEMTTSSTSRRMELRAAGLRNALERFAVSNGYLDLVEDGNWSKLYTIWKVTNAVVNPFLTKMEKLKARGNTLQEQIEYTMAQSHVLDMYQSLTGLWSFHDDVAHESRSYLEFGRMIGIKGKKLKDKHYIDMLFYLAKLGVHNLQPLNLGLSPTNNLLATGDPSADERATRILTLTVQNLDSFQVIMNVLYEEVGREIATDFVKEVNPKFFASLKEEQKDANGYILLSSVPLEYQRTILDRIFKSERFKTTGEFDLYLFLDDFGNMQIGNKFDFDNFMEARIDTSTGKAPKPRAGGMVRFDTSRVNANSVYHLSPEDLNNMFTQIQNQVFLNNVEIAAALGSDIGVADNQSMMFMNAERRKFYEMQRAAYADEMDVLAFLHHQSGTTMRTTNNTRMRGDYGLPLIVYDARYYVAGNDGDLRGTALDMAWGGKINQAINMAEMYGLEEEATKLKTLASSKQKYLIPAVILMAQIDGQNIYSSKKRLKAYTGFTLDDTELNVLFSEASNYVQAYLSAMSRDEIRNPYFHRAKRYVEINGPVEVLNASNAVLAEIGVANLNNRTEVIRAKKALERANSQYDPSLILKNEDIFVLSEEDGLTNAFGSRGQTIELAIKELVDKEVISQETAELYKGMFGIIMVHNEEFAERLSVVIDPNIERVGLSMQYGDRFVIKLNPELLRKRAVPEALEVMAHELSHIARMMHLETNGAAYQGFLTAFKTKSGQEAITDMVTTMFAGDRGEINELIDHYTTNPEEFLAEWGAFVLISRTVNNQSVINNIKRLREDHMVADESASWWERAFNRIKRLASSITQRMNVFRNQNPEAMELLDNAVEVMFNFGNTYSKSRAPVDNRTRSFTYPLTEIFRGSALNTEADIVTMNQKYQEFKVLEEKNVRTEDENATFAALSEELVEYISGNKSKTILNQETTTYIEAMSKMIAMDEGEFKIVASPTNEDQRIALATFVLEKVAKIRGRRGGEAADLSKIISELPKSSKIKQFLVDLLYNGTSRRIGEGGFGGRGGMGGGNSSNITYASAEPVLAALGFLLDATKGSGQNVFGGTIGGILRQHNYIQQWARPVVFNSHRIRNTYSKEDSILIEKAAFYYLLLGKPSSKNDLVIGHRLTDEMFAEAKQHAELYSNNILNFVDVAKKYGVYTEGFVPSKDTIAMRVNNSYFENASAETSGRFMGALSQAYERKILKNMQPNGIADPYSIYLSGGIFRLDNDSDLTANGVTSIQTFYASLNPSIEGHRTLTEAQSLIKREIESFAAYLYSKDRKDAKQAKANFNAKLKSHAYGPDFMEIQPFLKQAAIAILRRAKSGASYSDVFKNLNSVELETVLKELRKNVRKSSSTSRDYGVDILDGKLPTIFHGSTSVPKYMKGANALSDYSPAALHAKKHLMTYGHNTIMPAENSLDINARDVFQEDSGLSKDDGRILQEGFTVDLRSIIVGMERTMARSAYNRKAIQDLTGVEGITFAWLIRTIQEAKNDSEWDTVLHEVKRKHDLAVAAATIIEENEGSGAEVFATKLADWSTALVWGQNRNTAALINETAIGTVTGAMFGNLPFGMWTDLLGGMAGLLLNVFSRKYGNRLLNQSFWSSIPDALWDMDTATKGVLEHHLIDYDEVPLDVRERTGMTRNPVKTIGAGFWKRLRDSHLIAEPALRLALMKQGQRMLLDRVNNLDAYLDFIENYEGPINQDMYANAIREVGSPRWLDFAGTEKITLQLMYESGVINRQNIKAIKYIIKEFGVSTGAITRRAFLDVGKIQVQLEQRSDLRLWDEIPDSDGLTKNNVYEALAAIGRFQKAYAEQSIVQGNTLSRPTKGDPKSFLLNLYRSFPKLFVAQMALETYGRTSPLLFSTRLIVAAVMDIIYNFALMFVAGFLTEDDLKRIANGKVNGDDITKVLAVVARNPFISNRMFAGTISQLTILAGSSAFTGKNQFTNASVIGASLPPSVMAPASTARKAYNAIIHDPIYGSGLSGLSTPAADLLLRLVPAVDPILRYSILRALDPNYGKGTKGRGGSGSRKRGSDYSPVSVSNYLMDTDSYDEVRLLADILKELFPTGYANASRSAYPFMGMGMPQAPQAAPQAPQTPSATQSPAQAAPVAPTQAPAPSGPRATNPATPPPELGGP
jgi:hypothetical protein